MLRIIAPRWAAYRTQNMFLLLLPHCYAYPVQMVGDFNSGTIRFLRFTESVKHAI